jgi:hypothetical protein
MTAPLFKLFLATLLCSAASLVAADAITGQLDNQGRLQADVILSMDSLTESIPIDQDANGAITKAELNSSIGLVANTLKSTVRINRDNQPCILTVGSNWRFTEAGDIKSLVIPTEYHCPAQGGLSFQYSLPTEKPIEITIRDGNHLLQKSVNASQDVVFFENENVFVNYVKEGITHLLTGYDHVLFLFTLLLGVVLVRSNHSWVVKLDVAQASKNLFLVVTAFTLSHSLTLGLTVFGVLTPPSKVVEVAIALTMLASAANNIVPMLNRVVAITFLFGLIHGFGFAGVLDDTGFTSNQQLLALFAFNLGIEIGQLLIVAVIFPLLIYICKYSWYYSHFVRFVSFSIGCFALALAITRV